MAKTAEKMTDGGTGCYTRPMLSKSKTKLGIERVRLSVAVALFEPPTKANLARALRIHKSAVSNWGAGDPLIPAEQELKLRTVVCPERFSYR